VNLGSILPEGWLQRTLNVKMIQFQFDDGNIPGEITVNVGGADVKPGETSTLRLCFDYHACLLFNSG